MLAYRLYNMLWHSTCWHVTKLLQLYFVPMSGHRTSMWIIWIFEVESSIFTPLVLTNLFSMGKEASTFCARPANQLSEKQNKAGYGQERRQLSFVMYSVHADLLNVLWLHPSCPSREKSRFIIVDFCIELGLVYRMQSLCSWPPMQPFIWGLRHRSALLGSYIQAWSTFIAVTHTGIFLFFK